MRAPRISAAALRALVLSDVVDLPLMMVTHAPARPAYIRSSRDDEYVEVSKRRPSHDGAGVSQEATHKRFFSSLRRGGIRGFAFRCMSFFSLWQAWQNRLQIIHAVASALVQGYDVIALDRRLKTAGVSARHA
jgi:hypothetical protein